MNNGCIRASARVQKKRRRVPHLVTRAECAIEGVALLVAVVSARLTHDSKRVLRGVKQRQRVGVFFIPFSIRAAEHGTRSEDVHHQPHQPGVVVSDSEAPAPDLREAAAELLLHLRIDGCFCSRSARPTLPAG